MRAIVNVYDGLASYFLSSFGTHLLRAMELYVFARFHARDGCEEAVKEALLKVLRATREEPGCRSINDFRSIRDPRLFYVHSRFDDEVAFEIHANLAHTVEFLNTVEPLIDHPLDVTRAEMIG